MDTCCPLLDSFLDPEPYLPTKSDMKGYFYGLISSLFATSMLYGVDQSAITGLGFLVSSVCYKMVDYMSDSLLQGVVDEKKLNLIKGAIKTAGTVFAVFFSHVVLEYPIQSLAISFAIYFILSTCFRICDPLDGCVNSFCSP